MSITILGTKIRALSKSFKTQQSGRKVTNHGSKHCRVTYCDRKDYVRNL